MVFHRSLPQPAPGDPLTPVLFVIVMDMLNKLFVKANADGFLQPISLPTIYQTPLQHYADDVISIVAPTNGEVRVVDQIRGNAKLKELEYKKN